MTKPFDSEVELRRDDQAPSLEIVYRPTHSRPIDVLLWACVAALAAFAVLTIAVAVLVRFFWPMVLFIPLLPLVIAALLSERSKRHIFIDADGIGFGSSFPHRINRPLWFDRDRVRRIRTAKGRAGILDPTKRVLQILFDDDRFTRVWVIVENLSEPELEWIYDEARDFIARHWASEAAIAAGHSTSRPPDSKVELVREDDEPALRIRYRGSTLTPFQGVTAGLSAMVVHGGTLALWFFLDVGHPDLGFAIAAAASLAMALMPVLPVLRKRRIRIDSIGITIEARLLWSRTRHFPRARVARIADKCGPHNEAKVAGSRVWRVMFDYGTGRGVLFENLSDPELLWLHAEAEQFMAAHWPRHNDTVRNITAPTPP